MDIDKIELIYNHSYKEIARKYGIPSTFKSDECQNFIKKVVIMSILATEEMLCNPILETTKNTRNF